MVDLSFVVPGFNADNSSQLADENNIDDQNKSEGVINNAEEDFLENKKESEMLRNKAENKNNKMSVNFILN
ncbi:MAG: hypothetical protein KC505_00495 [Myxococcales bacterium]|nr:hypothetical protein [Myxococcales bacterium]USN50167.1 MAG: hypothetical protein H6731_07815 [Myxococcales bacterium]